MSTTTVASPVGSAVAVREAWSNVGPRPSPKCWLPIPPFVTRVLKEDGTSRVESILTGPGSPFIRKTYTAKAFLLWRTFLVKSKAKREHDNLAELARRGVPCVRPTGWAEVRVLGCTPRCSLATEAVGLGQTLKDALAAGSDALPSVRSLAREYGALVRALHVGGFLSLSVFPRNVLVDNGRLVLSDQPYLLRFGSSILGTWIADVDLYDAAFTQGRRRQLSQPQRLRLLIAYTGGDRGFARATWARLCARSRVRHRAARATAFVCSHLGRLFGARRSRLRPS